MSYKLNMYIFHKSVKNIEYIKYFTYHVKTSLFSTKSGKLRTTFSNTYHNLTHIIIYYYIFITKKCSYGT